MHVFCIEVRIADVAFGRERNEMEPHTETKRTKQQHAEREPAQERPAQQEKAEEKVRRPRAAGLLKRKPAVGVVAAGAFGLVAANVIGVGEMAIAMAAAYAAYRALTNSSDVRSSSSEAKRAPDQEKRTPSHVDVGGEREDEPFEKTT